MSAALRAYIEFWSEPDAMRRQTQLDACWSEQSEIIGPGCYFKGKRAVLDEAARFFRDEPGLCVVVTSGLDTHGDTHGDMRGQWWRFTMAVLGPSGEVVNEGWDIVEIHPQGLIARVISFWGKMPPVPAVGPEHLRPPP